MSPGLTADDWRELGFRILKGSPRRAAIWVAAALGVVAGCGSWQLLVIGAVTALLVLGVAWRLERLINRRSKSAAN